MVRRQATGRKGGDGAARPGYGGDADAVMAEFAHQTETGVADQWCASIGDERNILSCFQHGQQFLCDGGFIMFVAGDHRRCDGIVFAQALADARILSGNQVCAFQYLHGPTGHIG